MSRVPSSFLPSSPGRVSKICYSECHDLGKIYDWIIEVRDPETNRVFLRHLNFTLGILVQCEGEVMMYNFCFLAPSHICVFLHV